MAGKDHEDGSQISTTWELVGGCRRASQPHMLKGDSETQQKIGSGTPQPLPPPSLTASRAQVPTEKGDRVYRTGMGTEPGEGSEGPQVSLGEERRLGQAPQRGLKQLLFLGRKVFFFLISLGNWKPGAPPRAIKRLCPLTRLKIKDPHPGALCMGGGTM